MSEGPRRLPLLEDRGDFDLPRDAVGRVYGPALLERPGVTVYLARDSDGAPVSSVMATRAGAACGTWSMPTPPEWQRRRAGYAELAHAIVHQRAEGASRFYLFATAAGNPLYDRVGFRVAELAHAWVAGHAAPAPGSIATDPAP